MKITNVRMTTVVTLELSMGEAQWLRDLMRNPVRVEDGEERQDDQDVRQHFFKTLNNMPTN